jgi:YegS/Rv2252/BmrU family lipid kinase
MGLGRSLVIVNPEAKHGETAKLLPVITQLFETVDHELIVTTHVGHAAELAAGAEGFDVVVAVGGDGTAHEVLNGLMAIPADRRPALALVPTGSGNDTRRTIGVSESLSEAVLQVTSGVRKRFDVILCNGVYGNNSVALGLDARVTAKAVEYKVTKKRSGLWLYLSSLIHVLLKEFYSHDVTLAWDDAEPLESRMLIMALMNGPTYGGGFFIAPDAIADDGLLDVCMIDPMSLPGVFVRLPFVIMGKHTGFKVVHMSRHRKVVVTSPVPLPGQIDGEVFMETRYDVELLPGAIEYIVPRS